MLYRIRKLITCRSFIARALWYSGLWCIAKGITVAYQIDNNGTFWICIGIALVMDTIFTALDV
jgi:hypothetical protein